VNHECQEEDGLISEDGICQQAQPLQMMMIMTMTMFAEIQGVRR
jgi:hypothetical protein